MPSNISIKANKPVHKRSANRSQSLSEVKQSFSEEEAAMKIAQNYYNSNDPANPQSQQAAAYSNSGQVPPQSQLPYANNAQSQSQAQMKTQGKTLAMNAANARRSNS